MNVSSREVCYGYSCNLCLCFVGCKQCSCLWIRSLKRQERKWSGAACGNAFIRARACCNVLVLIMYFHQGTALWQWCCTCTCTICNMLSAMSFIRARACVSVLVTVICDVLVARCFHQGTGQGKGGFETLHKQTTTHCKHIYIIKTDSLKIFNSRRNLPLARKCLWTCSIGALVWGGD